jgi:hypothetical protein
MIHLLFPLGSRRVTQSSIYDKREREREREKEERWREERGGVELIKVLPILRAKRRIMKTQIPISPSKNIYILFKKIPLKETKIFQNIIIIILL